MKIITISYGVAIVVISLIIRYVVKPGIDNCGSMGGIVSTYTSQDYATGCQILSNIQTMSIVTGIIGTGIIVFGILRKTKRK
ncbi:MAG: hypothetical protein ACREA7_00280 [Nitrosotalea sp.]